MNKQYKEFYQFVLEQILSFYDKKKIQFFEKAKRVRKKVMLDDQIDTKDIFFGLYDQHSIGVFQKINWKEIGYSMDKQGVAYIGMDSYHVGLWSYRKESHWLKNGEKVSTDKGMFCATCTMNAVVSFSYIDFCFPLHQQVDIETATPRQILSLLPHVYDYFEKEKPEEERKPKEFYKTMRGLK